jgi:hypothetical protein
MVDFVSRLPSSLPRDSAWLARAAEIDLVNSAESVVNGGVWAMAFTLCVAGATGVVRALRETVRPAIEEWNTIAFIQVLGLTLGGCSEGLVIRNSCGILGAVKAGRLSCQLFESSLLVFVEVQLEICPGMFSVIFIVPGFNGVGMYAGFP